MTGKDNPGYPDRGPSGEDECVILQYSEAEITCVLFPLLMIRDLCWCRGASFLRSPLTASLSSLHCRAAPADAVSFSVKHTDGVRVEVVTNDQTEEIPANGAKRWPLDKGTTLRLSMSKASTEVNDNKVKEDWGQRRVSWAPLGHGACSEELEILGRLGIGGCIFTNGYKLVLVLIP